MESRVAQTHQTGHPRWWAVIALSVALLLFPGQTRQEQPQTSGATRHVESTTEGSTRPVAANADSTRLAGLAARFPDGVIPLWALRQDAPVVWSGPEGLLQSALTGGTTNCSPSLQFPVTREFIAPHFDSARRVWEIYVRDAANQQTIRHDIDSALNHTETIIPLNAGIVWIAQDLDLDGNIELVTQISADLTIYSTPDWTERSKFYWPGYNVVNHPTLVDLDDDAYPEIFATPNTFTTSRTVIIDYDPILDSFVKIDDWPAPDGAIGTPAVGDFDEDGRVEIISGNNSFGYGLFEWTGATLAYRGVITDTAWGGNASAVACRPKPDGKLYALLGHSSSQLGYRYNLLKATGDNVFVVTDSFQENTGATGIHPCWAVDVDCDGLDELVMHFFPSERAWEWNVAAGEFGQYCTWSFDQYGSMVSWQTVDLDQNDAPEWSSVNHTYEFRVLPGDSCHGCDTSNSCTPPSPDCYCFCHADPVCNGLTNVFDVVAAVDVAFRAGVPEPDPYPQCPYFRTDVNCDSVTNVFDVVGFVDIAFRSGDPNSIICSSCSVRSH